MFGKQAIRLLRKFPTPRALAKELFAMMNDDIPLEMKAPLTIKLPAGYDGPALNIENWGDGPSIQFKSRDGEEGNHFDANGDLKTPDDKPVTGQGGTAGNVQIPSEVFAGLIVGGSGSAYQCNLYSDDGTTVLMEAGVPKVFNVKQLYIDPAATIPVGTWTPVFKRGGRYFMQVPVWG